MKSMKESLLILLSSSTSQQNWILGMFLLISERRPIRSIDANLDAQYRIVVAEHLRSLSVLDDGDENTSSLGTQLQLHHVPPEMVRVAEKCYGVTFANNVSSTHLETRA